LPFFTSVYRANTIIIKGIYSFENETLIKFKFRKQARNTYLTIFLKFLKPFFSVFCPRYAVIIKRMVAYTGWMKNAVEFSGHNQQEDIQFMKKFACAFLCVIVTLIMCIPMNLHTSHTISALDNGDPIGEKAVDFTFGISPYFLFHVYVVGEQGHLFINDGGSGDFTVARMKGVAPGKLEKSGALLDHIVKVSVSATSNTQHNVIALRSDNSLYVWGDNSHGQFGNGTTGAYTAVPQIVKPQVPGKIVQVLATFDANYIVTDDGSVYASGDGIMLGNGSTTPSHTFTKVNISDVKQIAGDANTMYALKNDGTVYSWGTQVYDGKTSLTDVAEPTVLYQADGTMFKNVVDISCDGVPIAYGKAPGVAVLVVENQTAKGYQVGFRDNASSPMGVYLEASQPITASSEVKNISYGYMHGKNIGFIVDDKFYVNDGSQPFSTLVSGIEKGAQQDWFSCVLSKSGALYLGGVKKDLNLGFHVDALKKDTTTYDSEEKYNDDVEITVTTSHVGTAAVCKVEDPIGTAAVACTDFQNNKISLSADNTRLYRKYLFENDIYSDELVVDLYKETPQMPGYSTTQTNRIKTTDTISLPTSPVDWNTYSATVTDATGNTMNFSGGTLKKGTNTLHLKDAYGNVQDYVFEVSDVPMPTAEFRANAPLVYNDTNTDANGTVGYFTLVYAKGEPTSAIASIQLENVGDYALFQVDNSGTLKVNNKKLNAGTYHVKVSGTDANQMPFAKEVEIVVEKADQDNYQITNAADYPLKVNQEIAIQTSGNDSHEAETFSITNGTGIAQITNGNRFTMLKDGTFTLTATVAGNNNYHSKTVTKEITISKLPAQNPKITITSSDRMTYGDTYTPTYSGGQGDGAFTWSIENDNGTGAKIQNGKISVTGIGTFTLKAEKAGTASLQASTDTIVVTVLKRKTIVTPNTVTKYVGQKFKDNGVAYAPQPISNDALGTPVITSKYPDHQKAGCYTDGIQVSGLANPNYEFVYKTGTLNINDAVLSDSGDPYYTMTGTKGKNGWYISDIQIATTGRDGYDEISLDGITFQKQPIIETAERDAMIELYFRKSADGTTAKPLRCQVKIDKTPPETPTLTMKEKNNSGFARLVNLFSFGQWMNKEIEVTMKSKDALSGLDYYEYEERDGTGKHTKKTTSGIVDYEKDTELTLRAKACDKAGNCSALGEEQSLLIDMLAPQIIGVKDQSVYKHYYLPRYVKIKDEGSGLSYGSYTKDDTVSEVLKESETAFSDTGSYEIYAVDMAGNETTLSFKIVPLPAISDIDGSDASKEIIDQVKAELEEVKDKLDENERKDYEQWIEDAEKQWEAGRKKVIETDDKSAKIEGQGNTNFDPNIELIVESIAESTLPALPKKAFHAYDVYLQKGNAKIQPDGTIRVYLPYTDKETPIVYQIDENNNVTEIKAEKEGNYVTFVTDTLWKYAISKESDQPQENDVCVIGADGVADSQDEVCGKENEKGERPIKQPDGSVEVPDGGSVEFTNGKEMDTPNGAIIKPDGTVLLPDGTRYDANGNKMEPDQDESQCKLEGTDINVDSDGDGLPDLNLDINGDCIAELNIDTNFDNIPDVDIDTDGDGKADINIDTTGDGKADVNIAIIKRWVPNQNYVYQGFHYDTGSGFVPYLNIDENGDGIADRNIDEDGDGIADRNTDQDHEQSQNDQGDEGNVDPVINAVNTGDTTKWKIWWMLLFLTAAIMGYSQYKKRQMRR